MNHLSRATNPEDWIQPRSSFKAKTDFFHESFLLSTNSLAEIFRSLFRGSVSNTTSTWAPTGDKGLQTILDFCEPDKLKDGDILIEVGCGTGAFTRKILESVRKEIRMIVFEINPRYARYVEKNIPDPRLEVYNSGLGDDPELLKELYQKATLGACSIPCAFNPQLALHIFATFRDVLLNPDGSFIMWNLKEDSLDKVREVFGADNCIDRKTVSTVTPLRIIKARKGPQTPDTDASKQAQHKLAG